MLKWKQVRQPSQKQKDDLPMNDIQSLTHSKWRCQYHIAFALKYREKEIYRKIKADMGRILRKPCEGKGVEILEAEAWPDHIPHAGKHTIEYKCSAVYGALKGKAV